MEENYIVRARLVDPAGAIVWQEERWPSGSATSDWPIGQIRQDTYDWTVPADAEPGLFAVEYAVIDPDTGRPFAVQSDQPSTPDGYHSLTTINVQAPEPIAVDAVWEPVSVTELAHVNPIRPGQNLLVDLRARESAAGRSRCRCDWSMPKARPRRNRTRIWRRHCAIRWPYRLMPRPDRIRSPSSSMTALQGRFCGPYGESPTTLSFVEVGFPGNE